MAEPSLASNNPFRRRGLAPSAAASQADAAAALSPPASASSTLPPALPAVPFSVAPEAAGISTTSSTNAEQPQQQQQQQQQQQPQAHPHPTGDEFRDQFRTLPPSSEAPPSTTFLKAKPAKKVRVQSPPPSSPDSVDADFEARFPASGPPESTSSFGHADAFDSRPVGGSGFAYYSSDSEDSADDATTPTDSSDAMGGPYKPVGAYMSTQSARASAPLLNPFQKMQKTLGNLGGSPAKAGEGDAAATATAAAEPSTIEKGSLDVDAFRRLLLTGQAGGGSGRGGVKGAAHSVRAASALQLPDAAGGFADASSVSKPFSVDPAQETPRTSHEISETDDDRSGLVQAVQTTPSTKQMLRKKPPPPSSRHGRFIKTQKDGKGGKDRKDRKDGETEESTSSPGNQYSSSHHRRLSSSSDVNKPLPPPPTRRSVDEDVDSIFDREAAGKVPEIDIDPDASDDAVPPPRPPTPPNASHSAAFSPSHPISESAAETLMSTSAGSGLTAVSPPAAASPPSTKKPTPAPPPRRHTHNRSDSRTSLQERGQERIPSGQLQSSPSGENPGSRRSSLESTRSRTSSIKLFINAPAPPPPRRGNHASRPSASFISPTAASFASSASSPSAVPDPERNLGTWTSANAAGPVYTPAHAAHENSAPGPLSAHTQKDAAGTSGTSGTPGTPAAAGPAKLARPPPPPARNVSVRRKEGRFLFSGDGTLGGSLGRTPSALSVDSLSRRVPPHSHAQPPPPPPRARGSSRGSMDGPSGAAGATNATSRKTSASSAAEVVEDRSSANHILADLDALQREVDALRGRYEKTTTGTGG